VQANAFSFVKALVLLLDLDAFDDGGAGGESGNAAGAGASAGAGADAEVEGGGASEPRASESYVAELQTIVTREFNAYLGEETLRMRGAKLGVSAPAEAAAAARVNHLWEVLVGQGELGQVGEQKGAAGLLVSSELDWTLFWRELAWLTRAEMPTLATSDEEAAIVAVLAAASYGGRDAVAADMPQWLEWVRAWRDAAAGPEAAATMRAASPQYVPREWMLAEAYAAAELGDFSAMHELQRVLADPYTDQGAEINSRYYQLQPVRMDGMGGISFFS
jgi:uncharacterized protein YdiU (UPF0061 family)